MIADTITSFSCKRGLPEEKMAIGNIGTGSISTLAKLNTGFKSPLAAREASTVLCTSPSAWQSGCWELMECDGVDIELIHVAKPH